MEIKPVDARFAVSPQITPADIPAIAAAGFRKVISNRPDGEESGQPETDDIRRAAEEAGLSFEHIPVAGGAFSPEQVAAFAQARRSADGPVLAFCRTGTRSITIDTLANVDALSIDDRLSRAAQAGYDLTGQRQRLLQSAEGE
jgi:uncharacterized protein (TIGR01244 family)